MLAVIITLASVFNRNDNAGQPVSEWLRFLASATFAFEQFLEIPISANKETKWFEMDIKHCFYVNSG